jgi:prepilin-type N-terminal cleavage/methylation domain-containing protein
MNQYLEKRNEKGFTLIELLVAIVVVGILTAVAIVGIAGLTNKGTKSACAATQDAIAAAQAVHFANTTPSVFPANFNSMLVATAPAQPELVLAGGATVNAAGDLITGSGGWTLAVNTAGTATAPMTMTATNC